MSGGGAYLPLFCPVITLGARGVFFFVVACEHRLLARTEKISSMSAKQENHAGQGDIGSRVCGLFSYRIPQSQLRLPVIKLAIKFWNKMHENTKLKSLALNELELRKIVHILCFGIR